MQYPEPCKADADKESTIWVVNYVMKFVFKKM